MKYTIALLATMILYHCGSWIAKPPDFYWVITATMSFCYIKFLFMFARIKVIPIIIAIETLAILVMMKSCYEYYMASESQWFHTNFVRIMAACYVTEMVVIIMEFTYVGIYRFFCDVRATIRDGYNRYQTYLLYFWATLCTTTRKTY